MAETIAVIGMGYVGLPVATSLAQIHNVIGFDISDQRIAELREGIDRTGEVGQPLLDSVPGIEFTTQPQDLRRASTFIICVPTPIDEQRAPDLNPLIGASRAVGRALKPGSLVIYESTVYPGATEEVCAPILEEESGLRLNSDFTIGYSPERINPGDANRRFESIVKVVSGSTPEALDRVDELYSAVVKAGTHRAPSIKVAEAAKVIENTQRDLNIALVNELAQIFHKLGIDTHDVLAAAETKWNFLPFQPGLVGGHCIGVDPYYLTFRSQQAGHNPEVILAGRTINDSMGQHVASRVLELIKHRQEASTDPCQILVLGATFKENCPDLRNSRVPDVVGALAGDSTQVFIADPWVAADEREALTGGSWLDWQDMRTGHDLSFDAIVVAVAHREFVEFGSALRKWLKPEGIVFDVKGSLPREIVDGRL